MTLIKAYERVTQKMLNDYIALVALTEGEIDTSHLFTIGNHELGIPIVSFNTVISDLERIGAIHEENTSYFPAMVDDEFAYDKNGFNLLNTELQDVLYTITNHEILRNKFVDINERIASHENVILAIEENESAYSTVADINGFLCRADGLVTYQGQPVECSRQDKLILTILLQNHGSVVNYEAIKDVLEDDQIPNDNINKYVSKINNTLERIIGYKPIQSERGIGQRLQFH